MTSFESNYLLIKYEPPHDKTNSAAVRPAKTQISLGICPVWSESSLSAWRKLRSLVTHWVHNEDSDQTGRMPRLIWVFAGCTLNLLVLSQGGSYGFFSCPYTFVKGLFLLHVFIFSIQICIYLHGSLIFVLGGDSIRFSSSAHDSSLRK